MLRFTRGFARACPQSAFRYPEAFVVLGGEWHFSELKSKGSKQASGQDELRVFCSRINPPLGSLALIACSHYNTT